MTRPKLRSSDHAGLKTSLRLPDPTPRSRLPPANVMVPPGALTIVESPPAKSRNRSRRAPDAKFRVPVFVRTAYRSDCLVLGAAGRVRSPLLVQDPVTK